jgi:hypothetical protein
VAKNQPELPMVTAAPTKLDAAREELVRAADEDLFDAVRAVLARIMAERTRKTVAYELDVQPSQISESFAGEHKQLQLRWLPTFIRLAPASLKGELRDAILDMFDDDQPLSPAEEAEARAVALEAFGRPGTQVLEQARQTIRRRRAAKAG